MKKISNPRAMFAPERLPDSYFSAGTPWDGLPKFKLWEDDETDRLQAEQALLPIEARMPTNPGCEPTEDELKASQLSEELRLRKNFLKLVLGEPSNQVEADQYVAQWEASKDYWQ